MSPGSHALGRRLSELRAAQQALVAQARVLEADGTYALLAAGHRLTGVTAERARPALARVAELWEGLAVLEELVLRVEEGQDQVHVDDRHAARLMALVNGPSIVVGPEPSPVEGANQPHVPPTESWLRRTVTPDELLESLEGALAPARQVVAEVDAAWRELVPRVDQVRTEVDRMAAEMPRLRPLIEARAALDALPDRIVKDPLGAADELALIESTVAGAAGTRAELARLSDAVADAARTLAELEELLIEGRDAFEQSRLEIASPQGLLEPVDPGVLSQQPGLRPWLVRLERLVSEGDVSRAAAGLERWRWLADQTLAVARQVAEANARPSRRRRELEGLLRAARVKAGAVGRAEDPWVTELAGRAAESLAVPCDLPAAETAVEAFLEGLRDPLASNAADGSGWVYDDPDHERRPQPVGASDAGRRAWAPA